MKGPTAEEHRRAYADALARVRRTREILLARHTHEQPLKAGELRVALYDVMMVESALSPYGGGLRPKSAA